MNPSWTGRVMFEAEAEAWLAGHLGADSSISAYRSVLRNHVYPAIGHRMISSVRRDDIKALLALMRAKGLSASRIRAAHLVISAVLNGCGLRAGEALAVSARCLLAGGKRCACGSRSTRMRSCGR